MQSFQNHAPMRGEMVDGLLADDSPNFRWAPVSDCLVSNSLQIRRRWTWPAMEPFNDTPAAWAWSAGWTTERPTHARVLRRAKAAAKLTRSLSSLRCSAVLINRLKN